MWRHLYHEQCPGTLTGFKNQVITCTCYCHIIGNFPEGYISQEVIETLESDWVPLYLEGRTVIGKAKVTGNSIEIQIDKEDMPIKELMKDNLMGMSIVYRGQLSTPFKEEITIKEKKDE